MAFQRTFQLTYLLVVLFIISDLISTYDEGVRRVVGDGATAGIFATLPIDGISRVTEFFDVV